MWGSPYLRILIIVNLILTSFSLMILNAPKIKKSRAKNKTVKYSNLNPKENKKEIKIIAKVISEINFDFNNNKLKH